VKSPPMIQPNEIEVLIPCHNSSGFTYPYLTLKEQGCSLLMVGGMARPGIFVATGGSSVKWLKVDPRSSYGAHINSGIKTMNSQTRFVMIGCANALYRCDFVQSAINALNEYSGNCVVVCDHQLVSGGKFERDDYLNVQIFFNAIENHSTRYARRYPTAKVPPSICATIFPRSLLERWGGFDLNCRMRACLRRAIRKARKYGFPTVQIGKSLPYAELNGFTTRKTTSILFPDWRLYDFPLGSKPYRSNHDDHGATK
jgi:hypothetical protein